MRIPEDPIFIGQSQNGHHYAGHTHFWERALMSRRQFAKATVGASGAVLISSLWMPTTVLAHGGGAAPHPIPGGIQPLGPGTEVFHVFGPAPRMEPSTITDFHGGFGVAALRGMGSGKNKKTGQTTRLIYDVDMRFMQGTYIGMDGEKHQGTFSFV